VIRKVLTGSGECGEVNWRFLGLAMPAWVMIWALLLGVAGAMANARRATGVLTGSTVKNPAGQSPRRLS